VLSIPGEKAKVLFVKKDGIDLFFKAMLSLLTRKEDSKVGFLFSLKTNCS
jgi:hypothetical protein